MLKRIKQLLPLAAWFPDETPFLDAVLAGIASGLTYVHGLIAYAALQTRIRTASDGWLDLIAADLFGQSLLRKPGQSDASYRAQIQANLFLEKATRRSMAGVLKTLTGYDPVIVEPTRPLDTGAYGVGICGYGAAGAYGSVSTPNQCFITAYRPAGGGVPAVAGYGVPVGGYSIASNLEYAPAAVALSQITDADIYAAIAVTKAAGTICWVKIADKVAYTAPVEQPLTLDGTWKLDGSYTLKGVR